MHPKYAIVYADPPWSYNDKKGGNPTMGAMTYPTVATEHIATLDVPSLVAESAALFLWVTWPLLPDGLRVMESWGFRFVNCAFLWVKQSGNNALHPDLFDPGAESFFRLQCGLGHYTRTGTEPCLLGLKGKMQRLDSNVRQVVFGHVQKHSKKPDECRNRIVKLFGDQPRIELFARQTSPGWDVWGNEVHSSIRLNGSIEQSEAHEL